MLSQANTSNESVTKRRSPVLAIVSTALFLCVGFIGAHQYYADRDNAVIDEEYAQYGLTEDAAPYELAEDQPGGNSGGFLAEDQSGGGRRGGRRPKMSFCERCATCDWESPDLKCQRRAVKCEQKCPNDAASLTEDLGYQELTEDQPMLTEDQPMLTEDQPMQAADETMLKLMQDQWQMMEDQPAGQSGGFLAEDQPGGQSGGGGGGGGRGKGARGGKVKSGVSFCENCARCDWQNPSEQCQKNGVKCSECPSDGATLTEDDAGRYELSEDKKRD